MPSFLNIGHQFFGLPAIGLHLWAKLIKFSLQDAPYLSSLFTGRSLFVLSLQDVLSLVPSIQDALFAPKNLLLLLLDLSW